MICAACRADLGKTERVGRRDTCPHCHVDLHACRQCGFYDPRVYNECREPQAERVLDKERSNFCDYFAATADATAASTPKAPTVGQGGTRDALDRLFRRR